MILMMKTSISNNRKSRLNKTDVMNNLFRPHNRNLCSSLGKNHFGCNVGLGSFLKPRSTVFLFLTSEPLNVYLHF